MNGKPVADIRVTDEPLADLRQTGQLEDVRDEDGEILARLNDRTLRIALA